MSESSSDDYTRFCARMSEVIRERRPGAEADLLTQFMRRFYAGFPPDELAARDPDDVYADTLGWLGLVRGNDPATAGVEVFSPTREEHGFARDGTVVRIVQRKMPFLLDSIRIALNRRNVDISLIHRCVLPIQRATNATLVGFGNATRSSARRAGEETLLHLEISPLSTPEAHADIAHELESVLRDVALAVDDYQPMRNRMRCVLESLEKSPPCELPNTEIEEARAFLAWLLEDHFTFLGFSEMEFVEDEHGRAIREVEGANLGLLAKRKRSRGHERLADMDPTVATTLMEPCLLGFSKSATRCTVHRKAYSDYVTVKRFDRDGELQGELRFMGLYTSRVNSLGPREIPVVREKHRYVMERAKGEPGSFRGRHLERVLEALPREELFQSSEAELYRTALGILRIEERKQVRLFTRRDPFGRFVTCLVFFPRDLYDTALRLRAEAVLCDAFGASECEFTTYFSESVLARNYFVLKLDPSRAQRQGLHEIEARLIECARTWEHDLGDALARAFGRAQGAELAQQYEGAFAASYKEDFSPEMAIQDIRTIEALRAPGQIEMRVERAHGHSTAGPGNALRFKLFSMAERIVLSDAIPTFEHLGLRVTGENPYAIVRPSRQTVWLYDFQLEYTVADTIDLPAVEANFLEAFAAIWSGLAECDGFNRLILGTHLSWRQVALLRAYAQYMKQTDSPFSTRYIADTLPRHCAIAQALVELFEGRFDPDRPRSTDEAADEQPILDGLDAVDSLDEERIFRQYLDLIRGTLRTNFFQPEPNGESKPYIALKLDPSTIGNIPLPRPRFEIFVYSPRIEGVHLRAGKVARGGIRFSDRLEDYRTEILGLVKAQQVKNAVIVPLGAKGGFVAKRLPAGGTRQAMHAEGLACYRTFIRGLLDLTDNLVDGRVVPPARVVRRDDDDPYLVVAADKGTATFSDEANALARSYGFWLGDAFASGGSVGYDHKKMGITARGAWVSVQQHFLERGVDVQVETFTTVGIGDMSGDVFGNGMLRSRCIQLVAAFNHQQIFVDPDPDAERSFAERQRLFAQPRSSWNDYDAALISEGGGVFARAAKSIRISSQMRERFEIEADELPPSELIRALLRAPVDLVWNGGIGTYVKAACESHADVGDKTNDALRVDAEELRCKVIAEGGNLGMTQLARVAFCLRGGAVNTDFVDNAAGVDCSDHEVNIKILLGQAMARGDISEDVRRALLEEMTEDVSKLVLENSARQVRAIGLAEAQASHRMLEYRRYLSALESDGQLDRTFEFIPDDDALVERTARGAALTRPELAILISYTKQIWKERLLAAPVADDESLASIVESAFPERLRREYPDAIRGHQLRREILATQLSNDIINRMNFTFIFRLQESTGADVGEIALAYFVTREAFGLENAWSRVAELGNGFSLEHKNALISELRRMTRRGTRWLLRNHRNRLNAAHDIARIEPIVNELASLLPELLPAEPAEVWQSEYTAMIASGCPARDATHLASARHLHIALSLGEVAEESGAPLARVLQVYLRVGEVLELRWFGEEITGLQIANHWQALARESTLDDLDWQQRSLTASAMEYIHADEDVDDGVARWLDSHARLAQRWTSTVNEIHGSRALDLAMCSVALRELLDWAQSARHAAKA